MYICIYIYLPKPSPTTMFSHFSKGVMQKPSLMLQIACTKEHLVLAHFNAHLRQHSTWFQCEYKPQPAVEATEAACPTWQEYQQLLLAHAYHQWVEYRQSFQFDVNWITNLRLIQFVSNAEWHMFIHTTNVLHAVYAFFRMQFQKRFVVRSNFTEICSQGPNKEQASICSNNGLAPNSHQVIIWAKDRWVSAWKT